MTIDRQRIDEIAGRVSRATRGPWTWTGERTLEGLAGDPGVYEYATEVVEVWHDGGCGCRARCELDVKIADADREFIAHAREDLELLLSEVRRLRAIVAE